MRTDFVPAAEAKIVTWISNMAGMVHSDPALYGISIPESEQLKLLSDEFIASYHIAQSNQTRSPANLISKNQKKRAMIECARMIARKIQGTPQVTPEMKSALGLNPRLTPKTRLPVPSEMPEIDILSVVSRTLTLRVRSATQESRGRPRGIGSALIYTFVGENPPESLGEWNFHGTVTRTQFEIDFPTSVEPGTLVWITASWANPRGQSGPASAPVSTHIQFGGPIARASQSLRAAA